MVTQEEVAAAKAFLSELPIGIATSTGVAAVRTILASHRQLETVLREAPANDALPSPPGVSAKAEPERDPADELALKVQELTAALTARGAEAAAQKERADLADLRLRQKDEQLKQQDEATALTQRERDRADAAEKALRRADVLLREGEQEATGLRARVTELAALVSAAEVEAKTQRDRAEAAESDARIQGVITSERNQTIVALEARAAELTRQNSDTAAASARETARADALVAAVAERDAELLARQRELTALQQRIDDVLHSAEAHAADATAQRELVGSLRTALAEKDEQGLALLRRADQLNADLAAAKARLDRVTEALVPFAEMAESYDLAEGGWVVDSGWCEDRKHRIVVTDFRAARAALFSDPHSNASPLAPDLISDGTVGQNSNLPGVTAVGPLAS